MKNKKILPVMIIILLLLSASALIYFQVRQSIVGVSTYTDYRGDVHWLINGVADNIDEGYTFRSLPSSTSLNGDTITPQEEAVLRISKRESYCSYQLRLSEERYGPFNALRFSYYTLLSAERVALINVEDDSGSNKIIDGTITQTENFYDNGGTLEFKTLGTYSAKKDCPDGDNIAIVTGEDGGIYVYDRSQLFVELGKLLIPFSRSDLSNAINYNFLNTFDDYSIKSERFIGDVELGSVAFTIDADQDYYNSFIFEPAKEVIPRIRSIDLSDIEKDQSGSVKLVIENSEDSEGNIVIDASVDSGSISPQSKNAILKDSLTQYFIIKAPNGVVNNNEVCFEVCSTSSPVNCDESCENFDVLETEPQTFCGDNVCQSSESFTSCPEDCEKKACTIDSDCGEGYICEDNACIFQDNLSCNALFQEEGTSCGLGCQLGFTDAKPTCKLKSWVKWSIFLGVLVLILGVIVVIKRIQPKLLTRGLKR